MRQVRGGLHHGVVASVYYFVLRHCALFYVRYYRLGAAGDDEGGGFGKRGDLLNTNECSSMNSKVPHHYTTQHTKGKTFQYMQQEKRYSAHKGGGGGSVKRRF